MKHRKLRIAWSVGWGIVAVLLIALWVRSVWYFDTIQYPVGFRILSVESLKARLKFTQTTFGTNYHSSPQMTPERLRKIVLEERDDFYDGRQFHESRLVTAAMIFSEETNTDFGMAIMCLHNW